MNIPKFIKCEGCARLASAEGSPPAGWLVVFSFTGKMEESTVNVYTIFSPPEPRAQTLTRTFCSWSCILSMAQIAEVQS